LKVSRLARLANRYCIVGSLGTIEAGAEDWWRIAIRFASGRCRWVKADRRARVYGDFAFPLIENFVQVIQRRAAPLITGESTVPAVELLEQAYQRAEAFEAPWDAVLDSIYSAA
jgi:hypothetical protein